MCVQTSSDRTYLQSFQNSVVRQLSKLLAVNGKRRKSYHTQQGCICVLCTGGGRGTLPYTDVEGGAARTFELDSLGRRELSIDWLR